LCILDINVFLPKIPVFFFFSLFVAVLVDNFQLTLAEAEIKKQRMARLMQEKQEKYNLLIQEDEEDEGKQ